MQQYSFPRHKKLGIGRSRAAVGSRAMTLVELLIAVLIVGLFSGLAVGVSLSVLNREKVNSLAFRMAGWIEEVRNISAKRVGSSGIGCTIEFASNSSNLSAGSIVATVSPVSSNQADSCAPKSDGESSVGANFIIPSDFNGTISLASQQTGLSGRAKITYTPRGTWLPATSASGDLIIKLLLNGSGPMRCLRISETLAFVDIGKASTTAVASNCENEYSKF